MPYFNPAGHECLYSDAYFGGRLKPGFKHIVGDGESVHFSAMMRDGTPGRVVLTDAQQNVTDAERQNAYAEMVRSLTDAWKRPAGDQPTAEQHAVADSGQSREDAYQQMVNDLTTAYQR